MTTSDRHRSPRPELMDDPALPLAETERALKDLERVNRWLFGIGASLRTLLPLVCRVGNRCRLLDVGTGTGQIATALARSARRRGISVRVIGADRKLSHLLSGRRRGRLQLAVVASADALPFRRSAIDWVCSNLLLHHFDRSENLVILGEMQRVARRGVAIVDLRHSRWARILFRLTAPLLGLKHVASHDGRLSTDQAWSLSEVVALTDGLDVVEVRRRFPFRFSLVLAATED